MKNSARKSLRAILSELNNRIDFYRGFRANVTKNGKTSTIKFPRPRAKKVIIKSQKILDIAGHDNAIKFVQQYNRGQYTDAIHILKANRDIKQETIWLDHINNYFSSFGMKKLSLNSGIMSRYERLRCEVDEYIKNGCLVSIIMTVFNAEKTLKLSVDSILNQTWNNIELIIIDDNSSDNSWKILTELAQSDTRITLLKNQCNVGSYVSKNIALRHIKGKYFTCHDSDDWAHPERISKQVIKMEKNNDEVSIILMIRAKFSMEVTRFHKMKNSCVDGVGRYSLISCMFNTDFFKSTLGYWDSVRFSADSELYERTKIAIGDKLKQYKILGLICLDDENSLTNHPVYGIHITDKRKSPRKIYSESYRNWHHSLKSNDTYLDFPQQQRLFDAPSISIVPLDDINKNLQ